MSDRGLNIIPKDYRAFVRDALREGWTLEQTRLGHPMLRSPAGDYKTPIPSSSNSPGLLKAFRMRVEKNGAK